MLSYGLLAGYKLDETSGNRNDVLGTRPLTETGGTLSVLAGKIGNAVLLAATTISLVDSSGEILPRDKFSLACWVSSSSGSGSVTCFGQGGTATRQFLGLNRATKKITYAVNGTAVSEGLLVLNQWTHIALTYDGISQTYNTYQDGVFIASHNTAATFNNPTGITIGTTTIVGGTSIDEAYAWGRTLNHSEITSLYVAGNSGSSYPWNDGKL